MSSLRDRSHCMVLSPVSIQTQSLAFLAVFVYATHATQAIAFEWKPGFSLEIAERAKYRVGQVVLHLVNWVLWWLLTTTTTTATTAASAAAAAADDDDDDAVKAQSCDLHHCQLLIGRIRQLTTIDSSADITDTDVTCTSTRSRPTLHLWLWCRVSWPSIHGNRTVILAELFKGWNVDVLSRHICMLYMLVHENVDVCFDILPNLNAFAAFKKLVRIATNCLWFIVIPQNRVDHYRKWGFRFPKFSPRLTPLSCGHLSPRHTLHFRYLQFYNHVCTADHVSILIKTLCVQ